MAVVYVAAVVAIVSAVSFPLCHCDCSVSFGKLAVQYCPDAVAAVACSVRSANLDGCSPAVAASELFASAACLSSSNLHDRRQLTCFKVVVHEQLWFGWHRLPTCISLPFTIVNDRLQEHLLLEHVARSEHCHPPFIAEAWLSCL